MGIRKLTKKCNFFHPKHKSCKYDSTTPIRPTEKSTKSLVRCLVCYADSKIHKKKSYLLRKKIVFEAATVMWGIFLLWRVLRRLGKNVFPPEKAIPCPPRAGDLGGAWRHPRSEKRARRGSFSHLDSKAVPPTAAIPCPPRAGGLGDAWRVPP